MDNHAVFAKQVLRAVAVLYENHSRLGVISCDTVMRESDGQRGSREAIEAACGTVLWLYRNGIASGIVEEVSRPYLREAQLTAQAYGILNRKHGNVSDPTLGAAAIRASKDLGSREETVVAELILRSFT